MSVAAIMWAKSLVVTPAAKKLLLLVLADWSDSDHSCFPGQELLAQECSMSVRSIRKYMAELEADEIIKREARFSREGRGRTSDRIFLSVDQPADVCRRKILPPEAEGATNRQSEVRLTGRRLPGIRQRYDRDTTDSCSDSVCEQFETFWKAYPSRSPHPRPKKPALLKFRQAIKSGVDPGDIIEGARKFAAYAKKENMDAKFIPLPATWLHQERWVTDEPPPEPSMAARKRAAAEYQSMLDSLTPEQMEARKQAALARIADG